MPEEKPKGFMNSLWNDWLGKVIVGVATALITVPLTYSITQKLAAQPQFSLKWEHGPFALPTRLLLDFKMFEQKEGFWPTNEIGKNALLEKLSNTKTIMTFIVKNVGDRPAEEVALLFDDSGFAAIQIHDKINQERPFEKRLEIGRLAVGEVAGITLWCDSKFEDMSKSPTIVHSLGHQFLPSRAPIWRDNLFTIIAAITGCITLFILIRLKNVVSSLKQPKDGDDIPLSSAPKTSRKRSSKPKQSESESI